MTNRLRVAQTISTVITAFGIGFLVAMLGWGLWNRPLGTCLFVGFFGIIIATFWSMIVLSEADVDERRKK